MIYVHVPFCRSFCRYCGFYSETRCGKVETQAYTEAVCAEARSRADEIRDTLGTNTLYIGGGTPSVMPLHFFETLVESLPCRDFDEFTVEVNPDDITARGAGFVEGLLSLGVNRISMGVQSTDDAVLKWMGRRHDSGQVREAFRILRDAGVGNVSLDIIFGVNGMREDSLERSLDDLIALAPEHISAYQLSIEDGSRLADDLDAGRYTEKEDESCAGEYRLICRRLKEAGYQHYEISNWARPGMEAKHNSAYWNRNPYVGLGPGAHSLRTDGKRQRRSWNSEMVRDARGEVSWTGDSETLTAEQIREEVIMLGLRTADGIPAGLLGDSAPEGLVLSGRRVIIPEDKWFISDSIIAGLI